MLKQIVQPGGEDMIVDVEPRQGRWSRLLLLAGGVGLAWCALTTFGQASSASAAEDDSNGLLGVVSSTVQQTTAVATGVLDSVEPIVVDVVHTVVPPAPVAQGPITHVVTPVVQNVANVAATAVSGVAGTATSALNGTAGTVDAVSGVVAQATSNVVAHVSVEQALAPLLAVITGLPIVGSVADQVGVTDALSPVIDAVDGLLGAVAGTATTIVGNPAQPGTGGILPLPDALLPGDATQPIPVVPSGASATALTAQQTLLFGGLFAAALAVGAIVPVASASSTGTGRAGSMPLAPAGPSGSPSLLTPGSSAAATLWAALVEFSWHAHSAGRAALSLSDDALPGAPVFATDVSPD